VALLQLGASSAAVGVLTVVFDVCYLSVLPGLVRREQIQQANGGLAPGRSPSSAWGSPCSTSRASVSGRRSPRLGCSGGSTRWFA